MPGVDGSEPGDFIATGNRVYFTADDGIARARAVGHGRDRAAAPQLVHEHHPLNVGSSISNWAANGNVLYYVPNDPTTGGGGLAHGGHGRHDAGGQGHHAGTGRERPDPAVRLQGAASGCCAGPTSTCPTGRTPARRCWTRSTATATAPPTRRSVGSRFYFRGGFSGLTGASLWRSDGTAAGTFALTAGAFDGVAPGHPVCRSRRPARRQGHLHRAVPARRRRPRPGERAPDLRPRHQPGRRDAPGHDRAVDLRHAGGRPEADGRQGRLDARAERLRLPVAAQRDADPERDRHDLHTEHRGRRRPDQLPRHRLRDRRAQRRERGQRRRSPWAAPRRRPSPTPRPRPPRRRRRPPRRALTVEQEGQADRRGAGRQEHQAQAADVRPVRRQALVQLVRQRQAHQEADQVLAQAHEGAQGQAHHRQDHGDEGGLQDAHAHRQARGGRSRRAGRGRYLGARGLPRARRLRPAVGRVPGRSLLGAGDAAARGARSSSRRRSTTTSSRATPTSRRSSSTRRRTPPPPRSCRSCRSCRRR